MNSIKPGSIKGDIIAGTDKKQKRNNIERFLTACKAYGVPKETLFEVEDLLFLLNLPKVTRCLFALGKIVSYRLATELFCDFFVLVGW